MIRRPTRFLILLPLASGCGSGDAPDANGVATPGGLYSRQVRYLLVEALKLVSLDVVPKHEGTVCDGNLEADHQTQSRVTVARGSRENTPAEPDSALGLLVGERPPRRSKKR